MNWTFGGVSFAESWAVDHSSLHLRSRTNAFCFFFWKKKNTIRQIKPGLPSFGWPIFYEADQRFLLLFLKKEEYHQAD
jgi:hypothetical protein